MWEWIADTIQMVIEGASLLLSGGVRLGLVAIACIFVLLIVRWFIDEPVKFVRQWVGFFTGLAIFFGLPVLLGKHLTEPIDAPNWVDVAIYLGSAYLALKVWALIGGISEENGNESDKRDGEP